MKPKGWQFAVIALGAVAVFFLGWRLFFASDRVKLTNSYDLIDVETGEIFHVADAKRTKLIMPACNWASARYHDCLGVRKPGSEAKSWVMQVKDWSTRRTASRSGWLSGSRSWPSAVASSAPRRRSSVSAS